MKKLILLTIGLLGFAFNVIAEQQVSGLYPLVTVLETIGMNLQGTVLDFLYNSGFMNLVYMVMFGVYIYFFFIGVLSHNYEKVLMALMFVLFASLFKVRGPYTPTVPHGAHSHYDGKTIGSIKADAFKSDGHPSALIVGIVEYVSMTISFFTSDVLNDLKIEGGRSMMADSVIMSTLRNISTEDNMEGGYQELYHEQCYKHFRKERNFTNIYNSGVHLENDQLWFFLNRYRTSKGYVCTDNRIKRYTTINQLHIDEFVDACKEVPPDARGAIEKFKNHKMYSVWIDKAQLFYDTLLATKSIPLVDKVKNCKELRDKAVNEIVGGVTNRDNVKGVLAYLDEKMDKCNDENCREVVENEKKSFLSTAVKAKAKNVAWVNPEETANPSGSLLGAMGVLWDKTMVWFKGKANVGGSVSQNFTIMTIAPIVQGILLMGIYIMMSFIPMMLVIQRNFNYMIYLILLMIWVKSWPLFWVMISAIGKTIYEFSDQADVYKNMSGVQNYDLIDAVIDHGFLINQVTGIAMLAVPFITSIFIVPKISTAIAVVRGGG